jgi:hypothetical protein
MTGTSRSLRLGVRHLQRRLGGWEVEKQSKDRGQRSRIGIAIGIAIEIEVGIPMRRTVPRSIPWTKSTSTNQRATTRLCFVLVLSEAVLVIADCIAS